MQRQEDRFTFEDNDKFIIVSYCERCNTQNTYKIPLDKIFKMIERRKKATKGPIESIKALLNNQKPMLQ
jgi:hypothetical protein